MISDEEFDVEDLVDDDEDEYMVDENDSDFGGDVGTKKKFTVKETKSKSKSKQKETKKKTKKAVLKEKNTFDEDKDFSDDEMIASSNNRRNSIEKAALSKKYQKKTQLEHILIRPDTYIGSVEKVTNERWVYDEATRSMVNKTVTYVPGLYKIFDEILVNAADNKQRDSSMKAIKVTIDKDSGEISVWNDGKGIPIEMHGEHGCYIPELVFGHLLTGENFEDSQQRVVGGRNGYGAKLANIFSTEFQVTTKDSASSQEYTQIWQQNMSKAGKPNIKKAKGKDFTCVRFIPDYPRFGMDDGLDDDTMGLLIKRVYDIAGVTHKSVKVTLNGEVLPISTFEEYIDLYLGYTVDDLMVKKGKKKEEILFLEGRKGKE